jgi:DNA-binding response OmpR family regulator
VVLTGMDVGVAEAALNLVEVQVHRLRRKIDPVVILTVRGEGYLIPDDPA